MLRRFIRAPIYDPWVFTSNHNPRPTRPNPTNIANTNVNPDSPTPADRVIKPQPKANPTQPDQYRYSNANPDPPTPADRVVPILALGRRTLWASFLSDIGRVGSGWPWLLVLLLESDTQQNKTYIVLCGVNYRWDKPRALEGERYLVSLMRARIERAAEDEVSNRNPGAKGRCCSAGSFLLGRTTSCHIIT